MTKEIIIIIENDVNIPWSNLRFVSSPDPACNKIDLTHLPLHLMYYNSYSTYPILKRHFFPSYERAN